MAFKFPFTTYHELNLDWILKKVETLSINAEADANTIATYEERLQTAETQAQNAETSAANAQSAATSAASVAENALTTANSAQSSADASGALASQAATKADAAQSAAESARQAAETAQATAANFDGRITSAEQQASEALNMAQSFDEQARAAITTANNAANVATEAQATANATALELARQRTALETIGSQQTAAINSAGIAQVTAINNAGQAVLDSLPSDYMNGVELVKDYTLGLYPQIETDYAPIVSFDNGADNIPVKELNVKILPNQSGTGDPSPSNIRPISGWTGVNVTMTGKNLLDVGSQIAVTFPSEAGTVYGGTLDVTRGVLTIGYKYYTDSGTGPWGEVTSGGARYYIGGITTDAVDSDTTGVCNIGKLVSSFYDDGVCVTSNGRINLCGSLHNAFSSVDELKTYLASNPLELVYKLAASTSYQLTPIQVKTLLGVNNVWADAGNTSVTYRADLGLFITENSIANYTRFASMIAGVETGLTATQTYSAGDYFIVGQKLYKALTNIANGATFTLGTNCEETTVGAELVLAQ